MVSMENAEGKVFYITKLKDFLDIEKYIMRKVIEDIGKNGFGHDDCFKVFVSIEHIKKGGEIK